MGPQIQECMGAGCSAQRTPLHVCCRACWGMQSKAGAEKEGVVQLTQGCQAQAAGCGVIRHAPGAEACPVPVTPVRPLSLS